jgi:hypothetical protein
VGPFPTLPERPEPAKRFSGENLCALGFLLGHLLVFIRGGPSERKIMIFRNEKITIDCREPGGRREEGIFIRQFVYLAFRKENLCVLCVLSG